MTNTAESEYSAIVMPDGLAFAAVRVEADTTTVVLFVLGDPPTLQVADTRRGTTDTITSRIGRSLQKVPQARAVSFVDKADSTRWMIRTLDPAARLMTGVAPTRPGREDFVWRSAGSLLMADGAKLYEWNRGRREWEARQDFSALGITTITRLAASPDGRWIAFVADRPASP